VYRCRTCNEILLVDRWGQAISLRKGGEPAQQPAQVFQMLVPSDVNILGQLRNFTVGLLRERGFAEGMVDDVELALEEALCNVVEHAYGYDPTQTIALRVIVEKDSVSLLVRDTGKAFDPKELPKMDLEAHLRDGHAGGLGRYLMETLMDYIDYRSSPEGNTLLMEKKAEKAP
jgi:serine/threonine-protein kinase RsbW